MDKPKLADVLLPLLGGLAAAASPYAGRGIMAAGDIAESRRRQKLEGEERQRSRALEEEERGRAAAAEAERRAQNLTLREALGGLLPAKAEGGARDRMGTLLQAIAAGDDARAAVGPAIGIYREREAAAEEQAEKAAAEQRRLADLATAEGKHRALVEAVSGVIGSHPNAEALRVLAGENPTGVLELLARQKGEGSAGPSITEALRGLELIPPGLGASVDTREGVTIRRPEAKEKEAEAPKPMTAQQRASVLGDLVGLAKQRSEVTAAAQSYEAGTPAAAAASSQLALLDRAIAELTAALEGSPQAGARRVQVQPAPPRTAEGYLSRLGAR